MSVSTYAAAQILRVLPRSAISRALGAACEIEPPRPLIRWVLDRYSRAYDVALEEAAPEGAPYRSFDAFFTRRLRAGARPIAGDDATLVSPADGKLTELGAVAKDGTFTVKGQRYTLSALLGDSALAKSLHGGALGVVYLSPRDYHRVHSPVAGTMLRAYGIEGDRYPVNRIGEQHVPSLFVKNRRVVVEIDSPSWGNMVVVLVGAMIVGRMTIVGVPQRDVRGEHRFAPGTRIERGGELGAFHLGSTVVFATPSRSFEGFSRGPGAVQFGEALATARADQKVRT